MSHPKTRKFTGKHGGVIVISVLVLLSLGLDAQARKPNLWSTRNDSAPMLTQVPNFRALSEALVPAVVSIYVETKARSSHGSSRPGSGGSPFDDLFRYWGAPTNPQPGHGIGTGFVIRGDGLILTNNHVVEYADIIKVTFSDGHGNERTLDAEVVGLAPRYDVALIRTKTDAKAKVAYLGDSDEAQMGDWVMAVGNPFGLSHSVSVGIISAKGRRNINPSGREGLYDFIQTDASINPGNSGGPLVNVAGEVIGINTAINPNGDGIGFAIPINMVKAMLPELQKTGKYTRSWLGIGLQPLTEDLAKTYGLEKAEGALVSEVLPDSPAQKAGLQEGDVITSFDGKPVRSSRDLRLFAGMAGVGHRANVALLRGGKRVQVDVVMGAFRDGRTQVSKEDTEKSDGTLGMVVADISPELQRAYRLTTTSGVVVREVEAGGLAERAGIREGDVILSLNGKRVRRSSDFAGRVRRIRTGGFMRIQVMRPEGKLFLVLRKP